MISGKDVRAPRRQTVACVVALVLAATAVSCANSGTPGWEDSELIQPKGLAAILTNAGSTQPAILHVGFNVLYRNRRIPNSVYAGPGTNQEGRDLLRNAVAGWPKDREIVIYCGCCPWSHCPNMKPAMDVLHALGYQHVKALMIETNLSKDWIQAGYPTEGVPGGSSESPR